jgi:hypothetical protein
MRTFLGIDPGHSGAIAIVGDAMEVHKMPETEKDLWNLLAAIQARIGITYVLIEELHAMPAAMEEKLGVKRGSIAQAKLMQHYGSLRMALIGLGIRFEERIPRTWQKIMGLQAHGGKQASKAKAQQLFPQIKCTHAISDALLIASTARILWLNANPRERATIVEAPAIHHFIHQATPIFDPMETI